MANCWLRGVALGGGFVGIIGLVDIATRHPLQEHASRLPPAGWSGRVAKYSGSSTCDGARVDFHSAFPISRGAMTKKKSSGGSVNSVRKEIQRLDRDLLKLLADRARAAQRLAKIRQSDGVPLYDLAEEQQELMELLTQNKGPLAEAAVRSVFREILGTARALTKPIRVSYLGPKYSFSH